VRPRFAAWLLVGVIAVTAGVFVGRWLLADADATAVAEGPATDFRGWFWEHRALDLVTQAALVFAGALGVSAILPGREEPLPTEQHPAGKQHPVSEQPPDSPAEGSL